MRSSGLGLFRTARRSGRSLSGHAEICASRFGGRSKEFFRLLVFDWTDRKEVHRSYVRAGVARPV